MACSDYLNATKSTFTTYCNSSQTLLPRRPTWPPIAENKLLLHIYSQDARLLSLQTSRKVSMNTPNERKGIELLCPSQSSPKPRNSSLFEHVMPIQAPNLTPRDRCFPHSPPHCSHLPASPTIRRAHPVTARVGYRLPNIPPSSP